MTARGGAVLYTSEILALAVELAQFPYVEDHAFKGGARSRVCGSHVELTVATADDGSVIAVGARVSACAIGQAAAALFLRATRGRDASEIEVAHQEIEAWLAGGEAQPNWPGMDKLSPARAFPSRHQAILLPWKAALAALSNQGGAD